MSVWFLALPGCLFPFLMTVLGAAAVFIFRKKQSAFVMRSFLGFAAGVMLAATVFSLLNPAIAAAKASGLPGWLPAAVGMTAGILFLFAVDIAAVRFTCADGSDPKQTAVHRLFLLRLAMTLHNIPEGMAVGLSFALAAHPGIGDMMILGIPIDKQALGAAAALSLGIGIQNFPEGAATALPQIENGVSARKAFLRGCLSGAVEPIFGMLCVLLGGSAAPLMPWLLSFAAGAMLYVVCEELIPAANGGTVSAKTQEDTLPYVGTLSVLFGFICMMVLDVALG